MKNDEKRAEEIVQKWNDYCEKTKNPDRFYSYEEIRGYILQNLLKGNDFPFRCSRPDYTAKWYMVSDTTGFVYHWYTYEIIEGENSNGIVIDLHEIQ